MSAAVEKQTTFTKEEWMTEGERRFGPDQFKWRWRCPACNCDQSVEDFRPYKEQGATTSSAYQECLGRYTGGRNGPRQCDWAAYGLFHGPHFVVDGDSKIPVFEFSPY